MGITKVDTLSFVHPHNGLMGNSLQTIGMILIYISDKTTLHMKTTKTQLLVVDAPSAYYQATRLELVKRNNIHLCHGGEIPNQILD